MLSIAYEPLLRHLRDNDCPVCSCTATMCTTAIRLVLACRLAAEQLDRPIPQIPIPN